ncbi:MAG TPA: Lrp/AsnC family transcriptional regulator [Blastocatellia bacterium]|nr:Lrp/AsnC family transcriptional regulator [Blastocatellia bacterium]
MLDDEKVDDLDLKILAIIQTEARTDAREIARRIDCDASLVLERVCLLEERKVIRGYETHLSPRALGLDLTAFVTIKTDWRVSGVNTEELLAAIPEVQEAHKVTGEDCYLVKVRVSNTAELERLVRDRLCAISSVCSIATSVVLKTVKETGQLPLGQLVEQPANL